MAFQLPPLPYSQNALAPKLSAETLSFHYGKHLAAYVDNVNRLAAGTPFEDLPLEDIVRKADGALLNNAAQMWNHLFYFEMLSPKTVGVGPDFRRRLESEFGSMEAFKAQWMAEAGGLFGSGWTWLVEDEARRLKIISLPNAGNPLRDGQTPLLCVDVWEHAYYLDYQNRRADYLAAHWNLINWEKVEMRTQKDLFS